MQAIQCRHREIQPTDERVALRRRSAPFENQRRGSLLTIEQRIGVVCVQPVGNFSKLVAGPPKLIEEKVHHLSLSLMPKVDTCFGDIYNGFQAIRYISEQRGILSKG